MDIQISVDLEDRANRSETFPSDWDQQKLTKSIERYKKFLILAAKYPGSSIAPTSDIDQIWHLHMLSPVAYYNDCMTNLGQLLDHDGGFGAIPEEIPELASTFERTAARWAAEFGEPYVDDPEGQLSDDLVKCWHDCQGRCWNACKS
ncbi:MAG: hypothetical protein CMB38_03480 [Euryarchaeota archaeon]|nr:hypothetical protein [Euryarchaeota archaeon]